TPYADCVVLTPSQTSGKLDRMPRAYFDANIYSQIAAGHIPVDEVDAIRGPLARREILARLSLGDADGLLGDWQIHRRAAVSRLKIAPDLVGFDNILKQPNDMLREAIESYAAGRPEPSPLLPPDHQKLVAEVLHELAAGETYEEVDLITAEIVRGVRDLKNGFRDGMREAQQQTLAEMRWDTRDPEERRSVTFEAFWDGNAAYYAEAFAASVGLAGRCRERGIDGLLLVRPVRLAVGAAVSLVFTLSVPGVGQ